MSGKWSVEVDCARCGEPIPLGEVPSPEEEPEVNFGRWPMCLVLPAVTWTPTRQSWCLDVPRPDAECGW